MDAGQAQGVGAAPAAAAAPFPLSCLYLNTCSLSLQHTLEGGATPTPRGLKSFREEFSRKKMAHENFAKMCSRSFYEKYFSEKT